MAKPPVPLTNPARSARTSSSRDIDRFVSTAGSLAPQRAATGRLLFALDATMSRQPTWDLACALQAEMFGALPKDGSLAVQLLYFRGADECRASRWVTEAAELARLMTGIVCRGGRTQIRKVFSHAKAEHVRQRLHAVVYVGDAVEEDVDALAETAGQLGLAGCPLFLFQEGRDPNVEAAFREFARLSKGAYARFDANASQELAALLRAVAAYASGGRDQLKLQKTATAAALLQQLP
jgi:hypothetical protein